MPRVRVCLAPLQNRDRDLDAIIIVERAVAKTEEAPLPRSNPLAVLQEVALCRKGGGVCTVAEVARRGRRGGHGRWNEVCSGGWVSEMDG